MHGRAMLCVLAFAAFAASQLKSQNHPADQVQVEAPVRRAEAPPADATADLLVQRGDELRTEKAFMDALDYYHAALAKRPGDANTYNRVGIVEMHLERWSESTRDLERAIKLDRNLAVAHNNLGVDYYELKKFRRAIKEYETAIRLQDDEASYYSNMAAAYFARKEYEKAAEFYAHALQLDPDIFERTSRSGVSARLSSPQDRARYDYEMAKLYAKSGVSDRSLEHLRRAMEEGYKNIENVYKDNEFTELRKDPRFTQLMASRPPAIPE